MNVCIFQYDTIWMDCFSNLQKVEEQCRVISHKADLLVLPEMFNTGYTMKPNEIPVAWQDETIDFLKKLANTHQLSICGSIPMFKSGHWYNTSIFVSPEGVVQTYDKVHLFTLAGEKEVYQAGFSAESFKMGKWNIRTLICYDLRFPYLLYGNTIIDIIIYSANWPEARIHHWKALLIARAIENQCYVIGVNRTGTDHNGYKYPGKSMIINFDGEILSKLPDTMMWEIVNLDKDKLDTYRKKLPFLQDRKGSSSLIIS